MPRRYRTFTQKQKKIASAALLGIFLLFGGLLAWFIGRPMVRFVSEPQKFQSWVDAHGLGGRLAFIGMMVLQVLVAIIPGEPLEIGAGYAFGALEGTLLCELGTMLGSLLVFLLVRRFGPPLVELFFSSEKIHSLRFLQDSRRLHLLTFIVFFIPGTPKDLLTYVAGMTPIRLVNYLWITGLARIPSIVTSTIGGDALVMKNYWFAVAAFAVTALLSGLGLLIYRAICRRQNARHPRREEPERPAPEGGTAPSKKTT